MGVPPPRVHAGDHVDLGILVGGSYDCSGWRRSTVRLVQQWREGDACRATPMSTFACLTSLMRPINKYL
ncbi:hypothetical protein F751_6519 [Auxenochlorella protothecoides]|uniref:Uncharacterized protein n=1 Tax=Auxenochlorella protothecoides TaxID=3075 RepID=A0A087STE6_AUXPR|nr:hypothetical protein F751_6519 [Auxenochlorella protothecoides]KFM29000.1 hypothetical protein F751_6519 [Auxenochlorella protothecoides]